MRRIGVLLTACLAATALVHGQTLGEIDAAQAGMQQLDQMSATGGANPGTVQRVQQNLGQPGMPQFSQTGTLPNPAGGFQPQPVYGPPGAVPYGATAPGMGAEFAGANPYGPVQPGVPGQPLEATPTPVPLIRVLVGERVYCAVTGALLEDAVPLDVSALEQEKYLDDGIHDNGIAGDGIRGNVETKRDQYIGADANLIKNQLINVIGNAEALEPNASIDYRSLRGQLAGDPSAGFLQPPSDRAKLREMNESETQNVMRFYGLHVGVINPEEARPGMPNLLELGRQRDEALRDWNNKFLADYRVDKNDPRSEFYQLYVPKPPELPKYPVPPGYQPPQVRGTGQPGQTGPGVGGPAGAPNIYNGDPVIGAGITNI